MAQKVLRRLRSTTILTSLRGSSTAVTQCHRSRWDGSVSDPLCCVPDHGYGGTCVAVAGGTGVEVKVGVVVEVGVVVVVAAPGKEFRIRGR